MSIIPRSDISGIFCRPLLRTYVPLQIRASRGLSARLLAVDQCSAAWGQSRRTLDSLEVELWKNMKCSMDLIYELYLVPSTMLIDARCALELTFAVNDDNKAAQDSTCPILMVRIFCCDLFAYSMRPQLSALKA
jgi:hypothetical protein